MDPTSNVAAGTSLQDVIERIGSEHVERRLKIEAEHEAQLFGQGLIFFNLENWYLAPWIVRTALKLTGLYGRARQNADHVVVKKHNVAFANLPSAFHNFTILHISDLHADISVGAMRHLVSVVGGLHYDICVLTGDYRGKTYGPFEKSLEIINELQAQLKGPVYGVLGNHDSIRMAPSMEAMGICMLFNECEPIVRDGQRIFLAGVDDPHFYRADDIERAASQIPSDAFSILLAHTPEVYDRAMSARFDLMLCGHTHGGQLCLPGGIPIKLEAALPRFHGRWTMAPWCYGRIYLGGRRHEPSARALKLPAGDNSAYLARWAAALAHEQSVAESKMRYQNIPPRYQIRASARQKSGVTSLTAPSIGTVKAAPSVVAVSI